MIKIGIIKEMGRTPSEKRSPLSPEQCSVLMKHFSNVEVIVQPSDDRCFTDSEFENFGIKLNANLNDCDILLGIKEVPIELLIPNKTYFFFSHTLKKQPQNKKLLQTIIQKNIRLIDYECLTSSSGNRLIAFGFYAGIVGTYNGILTWGLKYNLFKLKKASECFNLAELENELNKVKLPNIKIALTGNGRVAQGAMHILDKLNIKQVLPHELLEEQYNEPVYTQLNSSDYHSTITDHLFDRDDFHHHPSNYSSHFIMYAKVTDLLIAGAFWNPEAPVLFTAEDCLLNDFKIKVIADITCDINGSIPCTIKSSTIDEPIYDYDKISKKDLPPFSDIDNITVMAVDNLPCEIPRDSSIYFGNKFVKNILPNLLGKDVDRVIERATMTENGKLTERFSYLQDYIE